MAHEPPNRVYLPDVRGGDHYLRATWHPESATIVFSHWNGEICTASTPVALRDCTQLIELQVRSLSQMAGGQAGPTAPERPRGIVERLRARLRPKLGDVIDATASFLPGGWSGGRQQRAQ